MMDEFCCGVKPQRLIKEQQGTDAHDKRMATGMQNPQKYPCCPNSYFWSNLNLPQHNVRCFNINIKLTSLRYTCKVNIIKGPQSNVCTYTLSQLTVQLSADCEQNKCVVSSIREINIDTLQWRSMLIK